MRFGLYYYSLLMTLCLASCATNTETGFVAANSSKDALIGQYDAPVSSVNGSSYLDSREQKSMRSSPRTLQRMDRDEPLTIDDIIKLHDARVEDQTVISYIAESRAFYTLTETQIRRLRSANVSPDIIAYMRREES